MKRHSEFNAIKPLLLAFLLASALHAADAPKQKPNIVYILADDMGYADAGFNGGTQIQTPNLNRLAKAGTVLSSFYGQPVCSPTRSSLMTGRYVAHTGVYTIVRPHAKWGLPLAERTFAQALREAGYETAITGKWHLGEFQSTYLPTQRGFDHQYGLWFVAMDYFTHKRDGELDWHRDDQPCHDEGYSTHLIAKEACQLIRKRDTNKPLFLYLPFNAVHGPLQVPDSYKIPYGNLTGKRKTYAGMVAAMDDAIGQVVATLDEQHMLSNTLILFSSDNGGPSPGVITDNGPLREGKGTIFEGGVRLCAFASWPGHIPAGKVVDQPVHMIDWYPTLVNLAGGSLKQTLPLDGKDIWSVLVEGAKSPHDALLLSGTSFGKAAVRAGDWKLLYGQSTGKGGKHPSVSKPDDSFNKRGALGSRIHVNHELLGKQTGKVGPIPNDIGLHTEFSSGIIHKDISQWTRWYQEDGNVQVFRLFKGEQNIRHGDAKDGSPGRVEAYAPALSVATGTWHEYEATYTVIKPVRACIFQLMHDGKDKAGKTLLWPFHIEMSAKGTFPSSAAEPCPAWREKSTWPMT